jgi:U3 small nucleolar RNA-associated protein 20
MAAAAPSRFPDLALLSAADEELCFFANVAHLQLHRRVRAFARLSKVKHSCFTR